MLGNIKGDKCFDFLADIMGPMFRLSENPDMVAFVESRKNKPKEMSDKDFGMKLMKEHFPALLKSGKGELSEIMAAFNGVSKEDYLEELVPQKMFGDFMALVNDPIFKSFLS